MCNGQTFEEAMRFIELTILHHGWAVRSVYPGVDEPQDGMHWSVTIGLLESFNHPELIMTDVDGETGTRILNRLGEEIRAGRDIGYIKNQGYEIREVHPALLDSELLTGWQNNYGYAPAPGQVWQVVLPPGRFCDAHAHTGTDLSKVQFS